MSNYGLICTARDAQSSEVMTVSCRFCFAFGREAINTRKNCNKPIAVSKHWNKGAGGFRTYNFKVHFASQHSQKWKEFQKLSNAEKEKFLDVSVPFAETLRAHFSPVRNQLEVKIKKSIVVDILQETLLEDGMFRLDDIFKESIDCNMYKVKIRNNQNFEIVIVQVMLGGSFRFVQRSI